MVWVGPHQDMMIEEDFILRFHRSSSLDGSAYLGASAEEMEEEHKRFLQGLDKFGKGTPTWDRAEDLTTCA